MLTPWPPSARGLRPQAVGERTVRLPEIFRAIVSRDKVAFLNADAPGIFVPETMHGGKVKQGQQLGIVADPLTGTVQQTVTAPASGLLFTLREYPVVYPGSLLARILMEGESE